ncbi:hypothetical protein [Bradyrhizobium sp. NBAIM01]|nr:hypothetical protein [Bradyrhizobium sp. NBAIM01]
MFDKLVGQALAIRRVGDNVPGARAGFLEEVDAALAEAVRMQC